MALTRVGGSYDDLSKEKRKNETIHYLKRVNFYSDSLLVSLWGNSAATDNEDGFAPMP